jgi:hypothetical protein
VRVFVRRFVASDLLAAPAWCISFANKSNVIDGAPAAQGTLDIYICCV